MAKERIYPFAVASVRSMENKLLTKQKLLHGLVSMLDYYTERCVTC